MLSQKLPLPFSAKSPEVMLAFYRRLFPYKPFYLWLNQEQGKSMLYILANSIWVDFVAALGQPQHVYLHIGSLHLRLESRHTFVITASTMPRNSRRKFFEPIRLVLRLGQYTMHE